MGFIQHENQAASDDTEDPQSCGSTAGSITLRDEEGGFVVRGIAVSETPKAAEANHDSDVLSRAADRGGYWQTVCRCGTTGRTDQMENHAGISMGLRASSERFTTNAVGCNRQRSDALLPRNEGWKSGRTFTTNGLCDSSPVPVPEAAVGGFDTRFHLRRTTQPRHTYLRDRVRAIPPRWRRGAEKQWRKTSPVSRAPKCLHYQLDGSRTWPATTSCRTPDQRRQRQPLQTYRQNNKRKDNNTSNSTCV